MNDSGLDLPDVNVLLALMSPGHAFHFEALRWFGAVNRFATTPVTELGMVRLLLNPAVMGGRVEGAYVRSMLGSLRADPRHVFVPDGTSLAQPVIDLSGLSGHKQVTDIHLLNLAASIGGRLVTLDRRIRGLAPGPAGRVMTL